MSISSRTILAIAGVVALAWALVSIANVLLVLLVSLFSIAVLSPVVSAIEQWLGWSRRVCATVVMAAVVIVIGAVLLVLLQAITSGVRDLSHDPPEIVDKARHTDAGNLINGGSLARLAAGARRRDHEGRGQVVGRTLFGLIGAVIAVPLAAAIQLVAEELTAARRARVAAEDPEPA